MQIDFPQIVSALGGFAGVAAVLTVWLNGRHSSREDERNLRNDAVSQLAKVNEVLMTVVKEVRDHHDECREMLSTIVAKLENK